MLEKQRHQLIIDLVEQARFASVSHLSNELSTSEATIRRDINKLFELQKLKKIRGGAESIASGKEPTQRALSASSFETNHEMHSDKKRRIAEKAVEICQEGEPIIVNGGTTTFMMGEFLVKRSVSILTNSFKLAHYIGKHGENQVTLPGGELYREQGIVLSSFEQDTIQYYHSSKMFMGTQGITRVGVTESDPLLIRAEQKMRKQADQLIVLADSSKIGQRGNFIFCLPEEVDILITDDEADPKLLQELREFGIEVIIS
ncbi:DeoR/GlpR family DNA-binding transcription regulator [Teredinibacter franksiae]|uniref:DeoR/GlpR family DNA-binding transcription regulator n=1 Tax=Teredinibacter franksiae TaxID=2761453 RepID=UPI0016295479|nr:DeoR family transcriptional regulator [Teredinibacter franksiae]